VRCTHFASYRLLQESQPEIGGALSCQRMLAFLYLLIVFTPAVCITVMRISASFWGFGDMTPKWGGVSKAPPKGTSLNKRMSYDLWIVKIDPPV